LVDDPQCLGVKLVEHVNEAAQLCGLFLGAEFEGLDRAANDLSGRDAEGTRLGIERSPLLRGHQNHQSSGCCHDHLHICICINIVSPVAAASRSRFVSNPRHHNLRGALPGPPRQSPTQPKHRVTYKLNKCWLAPMSALRHIGATSVKLKA